MLLCLQMNFEQKREKRNGNIFVSNSAFLFSLHADISFSETFAFLFQGRWRNEVREEIRIMKEHISKKSIVFVGGAYIRQKFNRALSNF